MLAAYYDRSEHTNELFENLKISKDQSYRENLNRYDVIKINIQEFFKYDRDSRGNAGNAQKLSDF